MITTSESLFIGIVASRRTSFTFPAIVALANPDPIPSRGLGDVYKRQLIESLEPIQKKYKLLINDPYQLNKILNEGREKAEDLADQTLKRVKSKLGFFEMEK